MPQQIARSALDMTRIYCRCGHVLLVTCRCTEERCVLILYREVYDGANTVERLIARCPACRQPLLPLNLERTAPGTLRWAYN
jgi:hypothetical protein